MSDAVADALGASIARRVLDAMAGGRIKGLDYIPLLIGALSCVHWEATGRGQFCTEYAEARALARRLLDDVLRTMPADDVALFLRRDGARGGGLGQSAGGATAAAHRSRGAARKAKDG